MLRRPLVTGSTTLAVTAAVAATVAFGVDDQQGAAAATGTRTAPVSAPREVFQDPRPVAAQHRLAHEAAVHRAAVKAAAKRKAAKAKAARIKREKAAAARAAKVKAAREARAAAQARRERASRSTERTAIGGGSARSIARRMLAARGWSGQYSCLNSLWQKESGWSSSAANPSSGAYGIPQALPGRKMASAGSDWRTNAATQIEWGLGYIGDRYGTPCAAWSHSRSHGWY
ncbi:hypothetical protein GCM10025868_13590 [Angustibacter aerolatus]|uniref:Lytic transglycosylase domain-containing protein n=1 Tax=Angustibacter aerolatus TaxID=1162965 RepID=A0ABQ6JFB8_9ACTN|nr:hypothetical protein [Angustibacter aerolatus]GMA86109.1 hypothetical protein GCM10025868_13590 [Angustibacter aerolatus]